jgi:hypothetical protein
MMTFSKGVIGQKGDLGESEGEGGCGDLELVTLKLSLIL